MILGHVGPLEAYRRDPVDFTVQTWANITGSAVVIAVVILLVLLVRPAVPRTVDAIVEAS